MSDTISVIIPVYNDPEGILTTLKSVLQHSIDEVIVVDNASTDRTPEVVADIDEDRVSLVHETEIQSSYAARNTGIRNASNDVLAFLDADMRVSERWAEDLIETVEREGVRYGGCNVELIPCTTPGMAARFDAHTGFPVEQYLRGQRFAPTSSLVTRMEIFEEVDLFDPRFVSGGDKEFGNRVDEAGYELTYLADVTAHHPPRNSIRELVEKDLRVGRGHAQLQRYYPDRYGSPGMPPRPSGVKRPGKELPAMDRLAFGMLGTVLTGMRGIGYYREAIRSDPFPDIDGPPPLG